MVFLRTDVKEELAKLKLDNTGSFGQAREELLQHYLRCATLETVLPQPAPPSSNQKER